MKNHILTFISASLVLLTVAASQSFAGNSKSLKAQGSGSYGIKGNTGSFKSKFSKGHHHSSYKGQHNSYHKHSYGSHGFKNYGHGKYYNNGYNRHYPKHYQKNYGYNGYYNYGYRYPKSYYPYYSYKYPYYNNNYYNPYYDPYYQRYPYRSNEYYYNGNLGKRCSYFNNRGYQNYYVYDHYMPCQNYQGEYPEYNENNPVYDYDLDESYQYESPQYGEERYQEKTFNNYGYPEY